MMAMDPAAFPDHCGLMLSYLKVENLAVVEKAELDFSPHLNILTGETGAGKSILIDAIMLLLNKKTPANIVRSGKEKLTVEALFCQGDEETILRREISKSKSLTYHNGELAPFAQVKEKAEALLNIYGQKDHVFLLNTANHQVYLDQFAQHGELLGGHGRKMPADPRPAGQAGNELQAKNKQARERIDYLNFQLQEIENLEPEAGRRDAAAGTPEDPRRGRDHPGESRRPGAGFLPEGPIRSTTCWPWTCPPPPTWSPCSRNSAISRRRSTVFSACCRRSPPF